MAPDRIDVLLERQPPGWRLVRSLWLVVVLLGLGLFSWLGFVWAASIARSPRVWRAAAAWCVASVVLLVLIIASGSGEETKEPWNTLAVIMLGVTWFGGFVHAAVLRRQVLREAIAHRDQLGLLADLPAMPQQAPVVAPQTPPSPRRTPSPAPPAAPAGGAPCPTALRQRLQRLTDMVRSDRARLPDDVQAAYERVHTGLAALVDRVERESAGSDSRFVVARIVDDYVPQALGTYVSLPPAFAREHRLESGRTSHEELLHQLDLVASEVDRIAVAVYSGDAQQLAAQSRFLEDRFARSSLQLPDQA